jgi:hypothetical protein
MTVYLSASSINDFIKCPQKVLYRIKKTVPEVKSKEMIIGLIAHSAIEHGWKDKERALSIIDSEVKKNKLSKSDRTNLSFMMDIFFLNFRDKLGDKDLIEYNFKISLYDDVFIVGKMDRISGGNLYDWKSGSKLPSRLGNDVQCIIYEWAYEKIFSAKPKSICLAGLATGELIPYQKDKLFYSEVFDRIIPRMIRTVRHNEYERLGMFNHSCFRCPYKAGCLEGDEYVLDNSLASE